MEGEREAAAVWKQTEERREKIVLDWIIKINTALNNFIWGVPAIVCIVGVGLLLTVRTRVIQVRRFGRAMHSTLGKVFEKSAAKEGSISPFQAVCTALAGTVGTGNIAGVAGAVAIGGPGAVFWMWCSAFLGMCTKFSEVVLAIHFREKNAQGEYIGGPMYYIKNGLGKKWQWLGMLYAAFGVLTVFGTGNATQVNTIVSSIDTALTSFNVIDHDQVIVMKWMIGIIISILVAVVLLGGIKRIGQVTEKLVPFMALLYIILSIGVIIINWRNVPGVFKMIFEGAFNPKAITGGLVGSQRGRPRHRLHRPCLLGHGRCRAARLFRHLRSVHGYHRHLHHDGTGDPVQRRARKLRSGRRCGADHFRLRFQLRQMGFCFHCDFYVLLRFLHHHRLGTVRLTLH